MRKYPTRPWVGIGVVVHKNQDILLIKRAKHPNKGMWSLPGGAQNIGETIFAGAQREVLEETCIVSKDHRLIDCIDSISYDDDGKVEYHYTLIEVSSLYESGLLQAQDDASDARWVAYRDLADYDLPTKTHEIIKRSYLSRKDSFIDE
jgi:8-oxo-dGTP diphosphatase